MSIKVLIVDDSVIARAKLTEMIQSQSDLEVVGCATDPIRAREMIKLLQPDVLTLDVDMPNMDGLDFLERVMRLHPMPVVMISSSTEAGTEITLCALKLGAADCMPKPRLMDAESVAAYTELLCGKIRTAFHSNTKLKKVSALPVRINHVSVRHEKLILVGASTGGTEAIKEFLMRLPLDCPAILIAQHLPEGYTHSFAQRMNNLCQINVSEAVDGEQVLPGHAYIAPGHSHLLLARRDGNYYCKLDSGPAVNRHRPSVDVLFNSAALNAGAHALGVILTGMGKDGAAGMLKMRESGSFNVAQDEASCIVFGMPRAATLLGAVHQMAPLDQLASIVLSHLGNPISERT
jgi:two-component system chemotaxis response regulator CheB